MRVVHLAKWRVLAIVAVAVQTVMLIVRQDATQNAEMSVRLIVVKGVVNHHLIHVE